MIIKRWISCRVSAKPAGAVARLASFSDGVVNFMRKSGPRNAEECCEANRSQMKDAVNALPKKWCGKHDWLGAWQKPFLIDDFRLEARVQLEAILGGGKTVIGYRHAGFVRHVF